MELDPGKTEPDEKTREELEKELYKSKRKLKMSRCQLQQTRSQMEIQALRTRQLVTAWTGRLEQAEERVRKLKLQKDVELMDINAQLMLLQGQLKREQRFIVAELVKQNQVIKDQSKTIKKLRAENRRLNEASHQKKDESLDDQYVTLASIDEMIKRKNSAQLRLPSGNSEFDREGNLSVTDHKPTSSDTTKGRVLTQDSLSDMNITQDDVFKDTSFEIEREKKSTPSFHTKVDTDFRPRSKTVSAVPDPSVEYSNHKMIKRRKNVTKEKNKGHTVNYRRSKHMSLDIDLNKSFDSVSFADSCDYRREVHEDVHWYFSGSDKENEVLDISLDQLESASFIISDDGETSVREFDRRTDGLFYRDVENTLRHRTVKRKRKRSKSLSDTTRMPVIFVAQSEPDTDIHVEINIDEAIARKHRPRMEIV